MTSLEASIRQLARGWIQYNPVRTFVRSLRGQVGLITHSVCFHKAPCTHVKHDALHL